MTKLKWSDKRPKKDGWYWVILYDSSEEFFRPPMIVKIKTHRMDTNGYMDAYVYFITGYNILLHCDYFDRAKWYGPLKEPMPPKL